MLLDQRCCLGATTQGLQPQRSGAREQVDCMRAHNPRPYEIEYRLAHALLHGAGPLVTAIQQLPPSQCAAHDPQIAAFLVDSTVCRFRPLGFPWHAGYLENGKYGSYETKCERDGPI